MSTFAKQASRFTVLGLAALMIGAALTTSASAASISWTGLSTATPPANLFWSDGANWSGSVPPATVSPFDDVTFTNAAGVALASPPTVTNEVDASTTINTLWYNQEDTTVAVHTTQIDPGQTLKISGNVAAPGAPIFPDGAGLQGNYTFMAGSANASTSSNIISQTVIKGDGTLDLSNATGGNTGGDIFVRETNPNNGPHTAILDLHGLTTFNASVDQMLVGYSTQSTGGTNTTQRPSGTVYLARNNTIILNTNQNSATQASLIIGYASGNGNTGSTGASSNVYLGQTNLLYLDNLWVGARKSTGNMSFNTTDFTNPSLTMRGKTLVDPLDPSKGYVPVNSIIIGDNNGSGSTSSPCTGTLDLTGGTVDILVTTMILGRTSSNGGSTGVSTGTFKFDTGTVTVNDVNLGYLQTSGSTQSGSGTATVLGTASLTVNTSLVLGRYAGGTAGSSTGTLNINGGTVTLGADITDGGGSSTLSLAGGTLDMQSHNIGSAGNKIDTLTLASGTLKNVGEINGGGAGGAISKTTAGTLTIDGVNTYTGATNVNAGKLLVEGSILSFVTVNDTATLGGKGTVGGLTVNAGGTLATGNSPGQLIVNGNVTLGGTDAVEINGPVAGTDYDQLVVNGTVGLGGTLAVTTGFSTSPDPVNDKFWILLNDGTDALTGTFSNYADGAEVFNESGNSWTIHYGAEFDSNTLSGGNDVVIAVVPEPATMLMLIIAAGLCLMFKRKRDK